MHASIAVADNHHLLMILPSRPYRLPHAFMPTRSTKLVVAGAHQLYDSGDQLKVNEKIFHANDGLAISNSTWRRRGEVLLP